MNTKDWRILLVDDEHEFITTLAERLELRGIAARVVFDGESALLAVAGEKTEFESTTPSRFVSAASLPAATTIRKSGWSQANES